MISSSAIKHPLNWLLIIYCQHFICDIAQANALKFEIIIVENGSIDSTFKIAEEISKKYSEVKAFHLDNPICHLSKK